MTKFPNEIPDLPNGNLGIIALDSVTEIAKRIDNYIVKNRQKRLATYMKNGLFSDDTEDSYLVDCMISRFSDGEAKCVLNQSVRGKDLYIIADIGNYNCQYKMYGKTVPMGPDEHYQDIKRVVSAIAGKAKRVSVIMPRLYASRQDKREGRESLDCAMALQELERLGVNNILTFDAHNSKVQNAIPNCGFENLFSSYNIIEKLLATEKGIQVDPENLLVISPDAGGMSRAIFYANTLGIDVGLFYKRRDYTKVVDGTNLIIKHEYMGPDIQGKDILIVDDMIASGGTMFDLMDILKRKGARNIYICVTFALFTKGIAQFNNAFGSDLFTKILATNLSYVPEAYKNQPWFEQVEMSRSLGKLINRLNYDTSLSCFFNDAPRIAKLINKSGKRATK